MQDAAEKRKRADVPALILGAAELAVLFLPVIFLTVPLLSLAKGEFLIGLISTAPPVITAVLGFFVILDRSARQAMLKWIFSLPFSAVFWVYFVNSSFLIRLHNFLNPSFGEGWAGDGFGILIVLGAALFSGGIGLMAGGAGTAGGMLLSQRKTSEKFRKIAIIMQKTVCPVICGIIFITVIVLSIIMPDYKAV